MKDASFWTAHMKPVTNSGNRYDSLTVGSLAMSSCNYFPFCLLMWMELKGECQSSGVFTDVIGKCDNPQLFRPNAMQRKPLNY